MAGNFVMKIYTLEKIMLKYFIISADTVIYKRDNIV